MNKLTIKTCPLCGGTHLSPFLDCTDHYATGEKFTIMKCDDCSFCLTQDAPVEAEIGRYYESPDYISHSDTRKGMMNSIYHWVRNLQLQNKASLVNRVTPRKEGRLLDIGTGTGYFSNTMVNKGWEVEAIEKNAQAREFAARHFKLHVLDETALDTLPDKAFDVVTMWHVMEHIEHINELWDTLYRVLADDGALIIAVPNCKSYDAEKYGAWWAAYDVPRHLWHFAPDTMQKFAIKHHFILTEQHPMPFDAFYVSMLSEKYKGTKSTFIKGMCAGAAALGSSWVKGKEQSSSMIYIFRKQK